MAIDESPLSIYCQKDGQHAPLTRPVAQIIAARRLLGKYPSLTAAYASAPNVLAK
jgi:hypothetical protein